MTVAYDVVRELVARGAVVVGRHLRFRCVAHADSHPSADYELEREVWCCRACHAGGGVQDLARRLGLPTTPAQAPVRPTSPAPPPPRGIARQAWAPAWTSVCETARRQQSRLAPYHDLFALSDWLRTRHHIVADARRVISALGPDDLAAWRLARLAARVETHARVIEALLDQALRDAA